jgi:YbgC/YbaW family acyl-CoA thioester hydrolase
MDDFRFILPYRVRIADINYGGHVSNAAVLSYFQDARIGYLAHIGPFSELAVGEGCGLIMPEAQVRYQAEMFLGDELEIGVRVSQMRQSALVMAYRITRGGKSTAEGTTALVVFDYQLRKARRIPQELRQAIEYFEGM